MKKGILFTTVFVLLLAIGLFSPKSVQAGEISWANDGKVQFDSQGNAYYVYYGHDLGDWEDDIRFILNVDSESEDEIYEVAVTSSNPEVAKPSPDSASCIQEYWGGGDQWCNLYVCGYGKTDITLAFEGKQISMTAYFIDNSVATDNTTVSKAGATSVKLSWKANPAYDGYIIIQDGKAYSYSQSVISTIQGGNTDHAIIDAEWGELIDYYVKPYMLMSDGVTMLWSDDQYGLFGKFRLERPTISISQIQNVGSNALRVSWENDPEVKNYELFVSDSLNGKYTSIFSTANHSDCAYTYKGKSGKQYYFKLEAEYADERSVTTRPQCGFIPKAVKAITKKINIAQEDGWQYGGNWVSRDTTFYYMANGKLHVVSVDYHKLYDYTLNSKHEVEKKKAIKLDAYDTWGGFYRASDGRMYVVVGYDNQKESDKKTVIKVIQYSNTWKKLKTCNIKGNASNDFKGIYHPFDAGNCSFAENGDLLYIFTAREMYAISGVHHQSNIAFQIDMNTMKYKNENDSYCSHSFNQYVRYDGDDLYLVDHGDAYPREILVTVKSAEGRYFEETVFNIIGEIGDNYTGVTLGGFEYVKNNILTAGTSVPQNYSIKGVSKKKDKNIRNVFVTVTSKDLQENKVVWLTNYSSKSKTELEGLRMVKLSESYVALLYNTIKNDKNTLHYVVLDNNGKLVFEKTYKDKFFSGSTQPILVDGSIVWTSEANNGEMTSYYNSIPAIISK